MFEVFRIKYLKFFSLSFLTAFTFIACEQKMGEPDHSGVYCLNIQNLEMTLVQTGNRVTFTLQSDILVDGTGKITGDTMTLAANTATAESFTGILTFSEDGQRFSGPYQIEDTEGKIVMEGLLIGIKGPCDLYDIEAMGIPKFVGKDFTQLSKIEKISKFRSGFGHSYNDEAETCRSMKHYYNPYENYRENNSVEIYSPVSGTVVSVTNDGHGESIGLTNKQIHIQPDDQPAFVFVLFHCYLISPAVKTGKTVQAGELIGHARLYYEDLDQHASSFDIALWVNTPSGIRLVSYFDAMKDAVFNNYVARGAQSRNDFIITREDRDADPLECNGETFLAEGELENWFTLN
jgi:hypothetical protein